MNMEDNNKLQLIKAKLENRLVELKAEQDLKKEIDKLRHEILLHKNPVYKFLNSIVKKKKEDEY